MRVLGVHDDLGGIRPTAEDFKPHIVFNLMEAFAGVTTFDQNVVSYLELLRLPYTGCNPRGLILARDKALSKKLLAYHRIPRARLHRRPARAQAGAAEAAAVPADREVAVLRGVDRHLAGVGGRERRAARTGACSFIHESLGTAAIVEQFIDGRELYVGVHRQRAARRASRCGRCRSRKMPDNRWRIATERVKWSTQYQKKHGIMTNAADLEPDGRRGSSASPSAPSRARPERLRPHRPASRRAGRPFVLEANPNPNLAYGEDFAESAEVRGISYEQLLDRILTLGLRWEPERTG